jgi:hypothetical protein
MPSGGDIVPPLLTRHFVIARTDELALLQLLDDFRSRIPSVQSRRRLCCCARSARELRMRKPRINQRTGCKSIEKPRQAGMNVDSREQRQDRQVCDDLVREEHPSTTVVCATKKVSKARRRVQSAQSRV